MGRNALADIVSFRRRSKAWRKSSALWSRWSYLPWQPLAALILIAATFVSIQFVRSSTHELSDELTNSAINEAVDARQNMAASSQRTDEDAAQPPVEVDRSAPGDSYRQSAVTNIAMPLCSGWPRVNCVIDGDTIWYRGEKIRIADINAPETHDPHCTYEADLGRRATDRLIQLLNAGPFEIVSAGERDEDRYGRKLRFIERNGHSLGQTLVSEGLAERWQGYRRNWCI